MQPNPQVTFTEEILNGKLHFLSSEVCWSCPILFDCLTLSHWKKPQEPSRHLPTQS